MQSQKDLVILEQAFNPADYKFREELGRGGYAFVFLAISKKNPLEQIAIKKAYTKQYKEVVKEKDILEDIQKRFNQNPQLKEESKQFLVQYYGAYQVVKPYKCIYLSFEYMNADNLENWSRSKDFTIQEAYSFTNQIAQGLKYLKQIDIVHKDIKPANIFLHKNGNATFAKIGDFGFAEPVKDDMGIHGTADFLAPEILLGRMNPSFASDVYAFGVTIFETFHRKEFLEESYVNHKLFVKYVSFGLRDEIDTKKSPAKISKLIQWCWLNDKSKRPTPEQICDVTKTDINTESDELKQSEKLYHYNTHLKKYIY